MHAPRPGSTGSQLSSDPRSTNLYRFSKKREARLIHQIDQEVLDNLLAKRVEAREAKKEVDKLEEYISIALRSGARLEPGLRTAELVPVKRGAYRVGATSFVKLIVL